MDMSFAAQALATEWSLNQKGNLTHKVYEVPKVVDKSVANLKLQAMGIAIDPPPPAGVDRAERPRLLRG
jgi:adenosylhomocysteinase